jgi:hypothetical protein
MTGAIRKSQFVKNWIGCSLQLVYRILVLSRIGAEP